MERCINNIGYHKLCDDEECTYCFNKSFCYNRIYIRLYITVI